MPETAVLPPPPQPRKPGVFTSLNAVEMGKRSAAARAAKAQRRLSAASEPLAAPLPTVDDYTKLRLSCVRGQLAQVDRAILLEAGKDHPDGQRLNWLAAAQERLAEQERILAGRPLPGSRRPAPESRTRAPAASLPDPIEPVPPLTHPTIPPLTTPAAPDRLPGDVTP